MLAPWPAPRIGRVEVDAPRRGGSLRSAEPRTKAAFRIGAMLVENAAAEDKVVSRERVFFGGWTAILVSRIGVTSSQERTVLLHLK